MKKYCSWTKTGVAAAFSCALLSGCAGGPKTSSFLRPMDKKPVAAPSEQTPADSPPIFAKRGTPQYDPRMEDPRLQGPQITPQPKPEGVVKLSQFQATEEEPRGNQITQLGFFSKKPDPIPTPETSFSEDPFLNAEFPSTPAPAPTSTPGVARMSPKTPTAPPSIPAEPEVAVVTMKAAPAPAVQPTSLPGTMHGTGAGNQFVPGFDQQLHQIQQEMQANQSRPGPGALPMKSAQAPPFPNFPNEQPSAPTVNPFAPQPTGNPFAEQVATPQPVAQPAPAMQSNLPEWAREQTPSSPSSPIVPTGAVEPIQVPVTQRELPNRTVPTPGMDPGTNPVQPSPSFAQFPQASQSPSAQQSPGSPFPPYQGMQRFPAVQEPQSPSQATPTAPQFTQNAQRFPAVNEPQAIVRQLPAAPEPQRHVQNFPASTPEPFVQQVPDPMPPRNQIVQLPANASPQFEATPWIANQSPVVHDEWKSGSFPSIQPRTVTPPASVVTQDPSEPPQILPRSEKPAESEVINPYQRVASQPEPQETLRPVAEIPAQQTGPSIEILAQVDPSMIVETDEVPSRFRNPREFVNLPAPSPFPRTSVSSEIRMPLNQSNLPDQHSPVTTAHGEMPELNVPQGLEQPFPHTVQLEDQNPQQTSFHETAPVVDLGTPAQYPELTIEQPAAGHVRLGNDGPAPMPNLEKEEPVEHQTTSPIHTIPDAPADPVLSAPVKSSAGEDLAVKIEEEPAQTKESESPIGMPLIFLGAILSSTIIGYFLRRVVASRKPVVVKETSQQG